MNYPFPSKRRILLSLILTNIDNFSFQKPLSYFVSSQGSNSSSFHPSTYFYSPQIIFCLFLAPLWFTKEVTILFQIWPQQNYPNLSLVPSTNISKNIQVHSSNNSNFIHCKFGPDLQIWVKFIFSFFQKFWQKSCSL